MADGQDPTGALAERPLEQLCALDLARLMPTRIGHTLGVMARLGQRARSLGWLVTTTMFLASCLGSGASLTSYLPTTARLGPLSRFAEVGVPVSDLRNHLVTHTVILDRGDLRIGSPGRSAAAVSLAAATRSVAVAMVNQQASYNPALVALARVSISAPGVTALPSYNDRLAWIGFLVRGPQAVSCPGVPPSVAANYIYVEPFGAVILDASTGKAVITYWSRGTGVCGGTTLVGPLVHRGYEVVSVPWIKVGQASAQAPPKLPPGVTAPTGAKEWLVRYTMPPCGDNWDSGGYYRAGRLYGFYIEVQVPMDRPSHCPPARSLTQSISAFFPLRHAPVGVAVGVGL